MLQRNPTWRTRVRATLAITLLAVTATSALAAEHYLIVTAQDYAGSAPLLQFANAKSAQGYLVLIYPVLAGTSRDDIKDYIHDVFTGPANPKYVLIVGDTDGTSATANTIPHWVGQGSRQGTTDLPYACMDGGDDWYPDLCIGRFSVRTVEQLQAAVDKTLCVEAGNFSDPDYVLRGAFLANSGTQGMAGPSHDWVIDNLFEPNDYVGMRLYAVEGAGTGDVSAAVNAGCLWTVYYGHSGSSGWWEPSFNQSNVNALTNEGLYGLAMGWSCNTAHFDYDECFGETWLRKANAGAAAYLSASNFIWWGSVEAWESSTRMERYFFEAIFDKGIWQVGPAWQSACYTILADPDFGPAHEHTRNIFEEFVLLGDPSLRLPGHCPDAGTIVLNSPTYACDSTATITVEDCGLNLDPGAVETVEITVASDSEPAGQAVILTETGADRSQFTGTLGFSSGGAPDTLLVAHGDTLTATYIDEDDGEGHYDVPVIVTANIDCQPPEITGVAATQIGASTADIALTTDEAVRATVYYGLACDALDSSVSGTLYETSPTVALAGLASDTTYYLAVLAEDRAGNTTYDDNGGSCYSFATAHGPSAVHSFPLDTDPGWATAGEWAFGQPSGQGGSQHGHADPTGGATGDNVYGVNLAGDYSLTVGGPYYLTLGPLDLTDISEVSVKFQRWLNVDFQPYVEATIETSNDGSNWVVLWENGGSEIADAAWSLHEYDLPAAGNEPAVYVRWGYQVGSSAWAYSGWNIDDIEIWGVVPIAPIGDMNCDESVNVFDIDPFVLALTDADAYVATYPECDLLNGDINGDGDVNSFDIDPFVLLVAEGG